MKLIIIKKLNEKSNTYISARIAPEGGLKHLKSKIKTVGGMAHDLFRNSCIFV